MTRSSVLFHSAVLSPGEPYHTDMATIATRNEIETEILTPEASRFLTRLAREFEPRRRELLERRRTRQMEIDAGALPGFLPETAHIREAEWTVAPIPQDLLDRRVEITGPVDRKMIINALNSGASVFMYLPVSMTLCAIVRRSASVLNGSYLHSRRRIASCERSMSPSAHAAMTILAALSIFSIAPDV